MRLFPPGLRTIRLALSLEHELLQGYGPVEATVVPFDLDMDRCPNNHDQSTDKAAKAFALRRTEPVARQELPGPSLRLASRLQCPTCGVAVSGMSLYRDHREKAHAGLHVIPHQIRG